MNKVNVLLHVYISQTAQRVISDALIAKCMEKEMSVVVIKAGSNSVVLNAKIII